MAGTSDDRTQDDRLKELFEWNHGYLQRTQAIEAGIDPHRLSAWVRDGRAERVQRGLYRDTAASPITHESLVELAFRVPHGVVCLRSALAFHQLGTASAAEVDLAIPNKARTPPIRFPPVAFYYFSDTVYRYGIEEHETGPATIRVYSPEKTLADLLYYRNKIGADIFLEGLQAYMEGPSAHPARVMQAARVRRVQGQMRTYVEALT